MDSILFEINQRVSAIVKDYVQDVLTRVSETHNIPLTELEKTLSETKPNHVVSRQTSNTGSEMKQIIDTSPGNPGGVPGNVMNCTMQTKLGKPCKYKCLHGQVLCKKHYNKSNTNTTNETKEHVLEKNTKKTVNSQKTKNKSPVVETPSEVKTLQLPPEEQSWFKEYETSHFPEPPDSFTASPDRDFEDYVLDE